MARRTAVQQRRRAQRGTARDRILDACRTLLDERPWSDIPLEDVMARAGLTRTAFYRHFDDREHVLIALLDELGVELALTGDRWHLASDDPLEGLRQGLASLAELYERHGTVLGAIADVSAHDPAVAERYAALADGFVAAAEQRLREDVAAGRTELEDPHEVARALVWMNERYLTRTFGRRPFRTDRDRAAGALLEVWRRTLYGPPG